MGIDAIMLVGIKQHDKTLNPSQLKRLGYELASSFHYSYFYSPILHEGASYYGESLPSKAQWIECNIISRYYGPGYERGPLDFLIAVAHWLEIRIPQGEIWYGGDSDIGVEPFPQEVRDRLFQHLTVYGHRPFLHCSIGKKSRPECPHCNVVMWKSGGGPDVSFFSCDGCGRGLITQQSNIAKILKRLERNEDFFKAMKEMDGAA